MKSCDEWVKHILEVRDKQLALKKKRRKAVLSYSALAACFCVTVLLVSQIFKSVEYIKKENSSVPSCSSEAYSTAEITDSTDTKSVKTTIKKTSLFTETIGQNTVSDNTGTSKIQTEVSTEPIVTSKSEYKTTAYKKQTSVPKPTENITKVVTRKTTLSHITSDTAYKKPTSVSKPKVSITKVVTKKTSLSHITSDTASVTDVSVPETVIELHTSVNKTEDITQTFPEVIIITSKNAVIETVQTVISGVTFHNSATP